MSTRRHLLNALPNVLWTVLLAVPVYVYCARFVRPRLICEFALASALLLVAPERVLAAVRLSGSLSVYRRLRVPVLLVLTQDAAWLQRFGGSLDPRIRRTPSSVASALRDTWVRERFHLALFLFFSLCIVHAVAHRHPVWASLMMAANVLYNLYPVWLQQYLRLRFTNLRVAGRRH